ncbi:MAG: hypothetical protein JSV80_11620 [Acidobacteriota bacterium]|nr:MAG: hypothetical protein JSV80_11620 [Acidobacteriota bacterium]
MSKKRIRLPWAMLGVLCAAVGLAAAPGERHELLECGEWPSPFSVTGSSADGTDSLDSVGAFADIPAEEISLGMDLPALSEDAATSVFGLADEQVVAIMREDFRIVARHSSDGGTTFGAEVAVAGGPGQLEPIYHRAAGSTDGWIYVAAAVMDPLGGIGLQVMRSGDMGQSWFDPVDIVRHGDPLHEIIWGRGQLSLATGSAGRMAVMFASDYNSEFYVTASADHGETWTSPVRVDPGAGSDVRSAARWLDVTIAGDGSIHVAYIQSRVESNSVYYARSLDGGVTFEAERQLTTVSSRTPDIAVTTDGSILIAYYAGGQAIEVQRSIDNGVTFTAMVLPDANDCYYLYPVLAPATSLSTVLLVSPSYGCPEAGSRDGPLRLWRSLDNGASFTGPTELAQHAHRGLTVSVARTPSGAWAVAWLDTSHTDYAFMMRDVLVRVSLDGGATWGTTAQAGGGPLGSGDKDLRPEGMTTSGDDDIVVSFTDGREEQSCSSNVYLNRSAAHGLAFGPDLRIDVGDGQINAMTTEPDVATDGSANVYVAFGAVATGPYPDIYLARSANGGYSFSVPQRVSTSQPGTRINLLPQVLARPDGHVYLLYQADDPIGGVRQILVNHSADFGTSWNPAETLVGHTATHSAPSTSGSYFYTDDIQFKLGAPGTIHVAWHDDAHVYVATSEDHGTSFTTTDVDNEVSNDYYGPALCVHNDQLVVGFLAWDDVQSATLPFGTVSEDAGANWSSPLQLGGTYAY